MWVSFARTLTAVLQAEATILAEYVSLLETGPAFHGFNYLQ